VSPRVGEVSVHPRLCSGASARPLKFTGRGHFVNHPIHFVTLSALVSFGWSLCTAVCPVPAPLYPTAKISADQYQSLLVSLKSHSGFRCDKFGPHQLRCGSDDVPEIWWLTEPGHPAHPAASRGQMLFDPTTGETCLVREAYYAGAEAPFAAWMKALKNFDELTIQRFKASQK
jgi:hypothetical protein